ncbi:TonB-dependent receptor domain-containing protein [Chitinophaga sp. MM2321]|uniref:TonB-dependent receptor domain-containing protein n=1 Tax=Chitinophaga sp. MM2321 TaxID=3137178 RepID=UPI0032D56FCC
MMLKGTFFLLLYLCTVTARAQQQTVISGQVADSITRKPVEYATVVLMQPDKKTVAHVLADDRGGFSFSGVAYGAYQVGITMLGYAPRVIDTFHIDSFHTTHRLGVRYLSKASQQLSGITVTGQRPMIEMKDDKLIYNVENDIDKDNTTASEILRKVPMITVDADGTIKLKGQTNYKVLLNGRSTSMIASNPKEALKAFPASIIRHIEIITEPSAKYDAEGIGGIINIVTQKHIVGYNGSIYTNYNTLGPASAGASLSARLNKVGVSGYIGGSNYHNRSSNASRRESFLPGNKNVLEQTTESRSNGRSGYGNLEFSYDIDSTNSLTLYGSINKSHGSGASPQYNQLYDSTGTLSQTGHFSSNTNNEGNGFSIGLDYQKKFRKPDHDLSFIINSSNSSNNGLTDNAQQNIPGTDSFYRNSNYNKNRESTIQLDYNLPLPGGQKLEAGAKAVFRQIESSYAQLIRNSDGTMIVNPSRSNVFNYTQNVLAFYTTYRFQLGKKTSMRLGARLEQTYSSGAFISDHTSIGTTYLNLIPTLNITRQFKALNSIVFSYSRRLQRPWVYNLNPYVNDNDPNNIYFGNPALKPSFTNSFGLYYNCMLHKTSLNIGTDFSYSNNTIQSVISIDSLKAITSTTYDNIGHLVNGGINVSMRSPLTDKWNINTNLRANYYSISSDGSKGLHNSGAGLNGYFSTDYTVGKGFRADAFCYFNTSTPSLQGSSSSNIGYGFTVRKELLHKKASLSISADQPFRQQRAVTSETRDASFYRTVTSYSPANAYSISFSWRFGKLTSNATRKKAIDNSDH